MTISILPNSLIDQINAGEVIENPVSVIKELVENSIDAGAKNIHVEVQGGGLLSIIVHDDGTGMDPVNARLCFLRHATSKLKTEKDLWRLSTLGFRGEALSSIAACSKMTLKTTQKGKSSGFAIKIEGGKVLSEIPCAIKQGTKIEVRSLFYNVPARQKFQKSVASYVSQILRLMQSQALLHIDKGFVLISQEKTLLHVHPTPQMPLEKAYPLRAKEVLRDKYIDPMTWVETVDSDFQLQGLISNPSFAQKTRGGQFLFINHRLVFSGTVSRAVLEGYGTRLQDGSFPPFILHLQVPKEKVDVNVHPQKREVRLENPREWMQKIRKCIDGALSHQSQPNFIVDAEQFQTQAYTPTKKTWNYTPQENFVTPSFLPQEKISASEPLQQIGLVGKYLLISKTEEDEISTTIYAVDLTAAYARCLFETFLLSEKKFSAQALLFPITLEISEKHMEKALVFMEFFEKVGMDIRPIGEKLILVEALPSYILPEDFSEFFFDILEDLTDSNFSHTLEKKVEKKWARSAVMIAKRYKKVWTSVEAKKLYKSLLECNDSQYDPMGQSIMLQLKPEHFEKCFERVGI